MLIAAVIVLSLSASKMELLECANLEKEAESKACVDAFMKARSVPKKPIRAADPVRIETKPK